MNCSGFESIVLQLARNEVNVSVGDEGLAHSKTCARCNARLAEEHALLAGIRLAVSQLAAEAPPPVAEASLLAAYRQQFADTARGPMPASASGVGGRRGRSRHFAAAAAVLILISLLVAYQRRSGDIDIEGKSPTISFENPPASAVPTVTPQQQDKASSGQLEKEVSKARLRRARKPSRQVRETAVQDEVATEFFPLAGGGDLTAFDSGQIVRIALSGSALAAVGLPVERESSNEPIMADVVLGDDGLAKAIRFVR